MSTAGPKSFGRLGGINGILSLFQVWGNTTFSHVLHNDASSSYGPMSQKSMMELKSFLSSSDIIPQSITHVFEVMLMQTGLCGQQCKSRARTVDP